MKVIVYGDFNSLHCYLASQRADRLVREGKADVEWCAVEHRPRLPVTGAKPPPGSVSAQDDLAEAAQLALPGEQLPAGPPSAISNTRAAVSAYAEAIADGIQDRLRLRSIRAQGRNMSSAYDVRRMVAALLWPAGCNPGGDETSQVRALLTGALLAGALAFGPLLTVDYENPA